MYCSNILVQLVTTPYFLLLDDDFLFTKYTRIERLLGVLLSNPDVSVVGGGLSAGKSRADYPGWISYGLDAKLEQHTASAIFSNTTAPLDAYGCRRVDATATFFMARTAVLADTGWNSLDSEALFLALKLDGKKVAECPGTFIFHQEKKLTKYTEHSQGTDMSHYPVCRQFPGMAVLRSFLWSIVCDRALFCKLSSPRAPANIVGHASIRCDAMSKAAEWIGPDGGPTTWVQETHQPAEMSGHQLLPSVLPALKHRDYDRPSFAVFLAVITCERNKDAREAIRRQIEQTLRQMEHQKPTLRLGYQFFVGNVTSHMSLRKEQGQHLDIVMLEADDGYENLLSKVTAAMRWTAAHVNTDYIVKVDDDVFLNIPTLWRRIHEMNLPKVCMYVVVRFLLSSFSAPAPPHTPHQYA